MVRSVSERKQFHGLRFVFLLLPPDYYNLTAGFSVPIQPRSSLFFHSLDPGVSLVQGQLLRHKENTTRSQWPDGEVHLLPAAACHGSDLQQRRFPP